jgi:putative flippase GtrA
MDKARVAYTYTAIATVASLANLLLQFLFLKIYTATYAVELSILIATAIILPFKYIADKKLIFKFIAVGPAQDFRKFANYTFVSIFTVAIFWGTEYGAHMFFGRDDLRYLGGAIGLGLSFYAKYQLDKIFVFEKNKGRI